MSFMTDHAATPFAVADIMTPRADLLCWERGTPREPVLACARDNGFHLVPIIERERINALMLVNAQGSEPAERPLDRSWLVSSDTGLTDLLSLLIIASEERPALLVLYGQEVVGLVSAADLNKLVMRVYLYPLIGRLEMGLKALVERRFASADGDLIDLLSNERRGQVVDALAKARDGDTDMDPLELLYLTDLLTIVEKDPSLRTSLGFSSRNKANTKLGGLSDFRNQIMHPSKALVQDKGASLRKLGDRLDRLKALMQQLELPIESAQQDRTT